LLKNFHYLAFAEKYKDWRWYIAQDSELKRTLQPGANTGGQQTQYWGEPAHAYGQHYSDEVGEGFFSVLSPSEHSAHPEASGSSHPEWPKAGVMAQLLGFQKCRTDWWSSSPSTIRPKALDSEILSCSRADAPAVRKQN
jgi:hypothetical protein